MLRKIQIFQKDAAQNTGNFVAQNTDFSENCSAKYSKKLLCLCCANYKRCAKYNKPVYEQLNIVSVHKFLYEDQDRPQTSRPKQHLVKIGSMYTKGAVIINGKYLPRVFSGI